MRATPAIRPLVAFLLTALLMSCAVEPKVRADYDKTVDFRSYKTYGFVDQLGTDREGYSSLITREFKNSIRREMDARGYTYSATNPDLLVNFAANVRNMQDVRSTGGGAYYGYRGGMYSAWPAYDVHTVNYKQGTANVDIIDASKRQMIWEGVVEGELSDKAMQDPQGAVAIVITKMFTKFPIAAPSTAQPKAALTPERSSLFEAYVAFQSSLATEVRQ